MSEEEPFLRSILASPADRSLRLVYADWLEERGDIRADYVRRGHLGEMPADAPEWMRANKAIRERMLLPGWWVAILGGLKSSSGFLHLADRAEIEKVARHLDRPVDFTDTEGFGHSIHAVATSGLHDAIARLDCRQRWEGDVLNIHFHLRIREAAGDEVEWEPETYNPYFGCKPLFFEWYGDAVVFIYVEKHHTYVSRLLRDGHISFLPIERDWILDGYQLAFQHGRDASVQRVTIPDLEALPALSNPEAARAGLLPANGPNGPAVFRDTNRMP